MGFSFLIVDDETLSRNYISDLIMEYDPSSVVYETSSFECARSILEKDKPDILFMDIKISGADGFSLLELIQEKDFELVFITSWSQYAIKAFEVGACDFLLKPIRKKDFIKALERALQRRSNELERRTYVTNDPNNYYTRKLLINQQTGSRLVMLSNILYLKASNSYTTLYMADGEVIVTSKPMHLFEKKLDADYFFRIHKSYIVNLIHFAGYHPGNQKPILLVNGERLPVSRNRSNDFLAQIKGISEII